MRILIVEDDMTIALMLEDMLVDCGHEVAAVAMRLEQAMEYALKPTFDLALLDVNLAGQMSFPVADRLRDHCVPFIFATGYGTAGIPMGYAGSRVLKKPFSQRDLANAIQSVSSAPLPE